MAISGLLNKIKIKQWGNENKDHIHVELLSVLISLTKSFIITNDIVLKQYNEKNQ